jgi:hypothetical protein
MSNIQFIVLLLTIVACTVVNVHYITKHSVHPVHGNIEFNSNCHPWEAC